MSVVGRQGHLDENLTCPQRLLNRYILPYFSATTVRMVKGFLFHQFETLLSRLNH
jgi:hypothetical protein